LKTAKNGNPARFVPDLLFVRSVIGGPASPLRRHFRPKKNPAAFERLREFFRPDGLWGRYHDFERVQFVSFDGRQSDIGINMMEIVIFGKRHSPEFDLVILWVRTSAICPNGIGNQFLRELL